MTTGNRGGDKTQEQDLPTLHPFPSYSLISHKLLMSYFLITFGTTHSSIFVAVLCPTHTVGYSLIIYRDQNDVLLDSSAYYQPTFKLCLFFQKENKVYRSQSPRLQTMK